MKAILSLIAIVLCLSCNSEPNIEFPIEVGTKPESITKGFNDNYYVTVMNNKETGDGTVVVFGKFAVLQSFGEICKPVLVRGVKPRFIESLK